MAIRILQPPEPDCSILGNENRRPPGDEPILIESDAARNLAEEIRAYCLHRNNGRSFLIAGHRGAGKTTLIHAAMLLVRQDLRGDPNSCAPLLVSLQGPTLFPKKSPPPTKNPEKSAENADQPAAKTGAKSAEDASQPAAAKTGTASPANLADEAAEKPAEPAETLLKEVTLCLHRAAVDEFVRRIRAFADEVASRELYGINTDFAWSWELRRLRESVGSFTGWVQALWLLITIGIRGAWWGLGLGWRRFQRFPSTPKPTELDELASQLELELDEFPSTARLMEFWRRIESFRQGQYRPGRSAFFRQQNLSRRGMREIVALATLNQARRRVAGKLTSEEQDDESNDRSSEANLSGESGDFIKVVSSLLAGAAAGAGVHAINETSVVAPAAVGIVTALGSLAAFKYSATWSRKRSLERKELFVRDTSAATLERVLPVMIARLREAGLAPVFVIDELDKVEKLEERMLEVIPHLKKLMAERAFFCFIADRSYFEHFRAVAADHTYVKEYTFFTHLLFVSYSHLDYHRYLRRLLELPDVGTVAATPVGSTTH